MHPPNTNYPAFILAQEEFKLGDTVTIKVWATDRQAKPV
jgi:hypothetical protein